MVNSDFNFYYDRNNPSGTIINKFWKYNSEGTGNGNLYHNLSTTSYTYLSLENNIFFLDANMVGIDNADHEKNSTVQDGTTYKVYYNQSL